MLAFICFNDIFLLSKNERKVYKVINLLRVIFHVNVLNVYCFYRRMVKTTYWTLSFIKGDRFQRRHRELSNVNKTTSDMTNEKESKNMHIY